MNFICSDFPSAADMPSPAPVSFQWTPPLYRICECSPVGNTLRRLGGVRIQKYDDALADILRADFSPTPSDWTCPRCPHYFIEVPEKNGEKTCLCTPLG